MHIQSTKSAVHKKAIFFKLTFLEVYPVPLISSMERRT